MNGERSLSIANTRLTWLLSRVEVYKTFRAIHKEGIAHRDVAARNIVRRAEGTICVVDFGAASLDHRCPGLKCLELTRLRDRLDGELSDEPSY
ncbi:hypothetical protein B0H17DRAFT_1091710 [Mycena rosella]|uniref:Protein kinase domain-containing protein n=1 Tax=Mycena rosella TaxID=1033263 RepID=A0AAD7G3S7_MYCRO|nr:hypothetical protein B0H17DRAFT_1091710 [Mycena rosella]